MGLSLFRVSRLVFGLTLLFLVTPPAYSQYEDMADVNVDSANTAQLVAKSPYTTKPITNSDINDRLNQISSCIDLRNTSVVKSYIVHYLTRPEKTKRILSRMVTYFPMFERKLQEQEVPDALKYLAVVESALNPTAVSRVGASGLWQFMPATGLDYGMQINSAIDERNNVVKSTESAAKYLKHLYNQFNDWNLALAAYNSGPNRVNGAIRRAGSRNFWIIQRFLPQETRNYVPAFIAATYICNFYNEHNLEPEYPDMDAQIVDHIAVYDGISFSAIAKATGLTYKMVSELNPGFNRSYIPPSKRGYYLTLPKRVMPALVRHLNGLGGNNYKLDTNEYGNDSEGFGSTGNQYYSTLLAVTETDFADQFGAKIGLSGSQLKAWNKLTNPYVYANSTVKIWHPVPVLKHLNGIEVSSLIKNENAVSAPVKIEPSVKVPAKSAATKPMVTTTKPSPNGGSTTVTTFTRPATNPPAPSNGAKPIATTTAKPVATTTSKPVVEKPSPVSSTATNTGKTNTATAAVKPSASTAVAPSGTTTVIKTSSGNLKQYIFHKVKEKETVGDLARRYNVSEDALMQLNNTSELKPGMLVKIKEMK